MDDGSEDSSRTQRQRVEPGPKSIADGVGNCRSDGGHDRRAHALRTERPSIGIRNFDQDCVDNGHVACHQDLVPHEVRVDGLPLIVDQLLAEGVANAVVNATLDLTSATKDVDHLSNILGCDITKDPHHTGAVVDFDLTKVGANNRERILVLGYEAAFDQDTLER